MFSTTRAGGEIKEKRRKLLLCFVEKPVVPPLGGKGCGACEGLWLCWFGSNPEKLPADPFPCRYII